MEIDEAVKYLREGGLIAYPTETVWGLGALNSRQDALKSLINLKGREVAKGMSLLIADLAMAEEYAFIEDERAREFLRIVWPGPITVVLKARSKVAKEVHGGNEEVGLRLSSHPVIQQLMDKLAEPFTTTSANLSGQPAARGRDELFWLPPSVGVIKDGESEGDLASTVVRLSQGRVSLLREGCVVQKELIQTAEVCQLKFFEN